MQSLLTANYHWEPVCQLLIGCRWLCAGVCASDCLWLCQWLCDYVGDFVAMSVTEAVSVIFVVSVPLSLWLCGCVSDFVDVRQWLWRSAGESPYDKSPRVYAQGTCHRDTVLLQVPATSPLCEQLQGTSGTGPGASRLMCTDLETVCRWPCVGGCVCPWPCVSDFVAVCPWLCVSCVSVTLWLWLCRWLCRCVSWQLVDRSLTSRCVNCFSK